MISFIQLVADMLHVLSYVVLIRQIKVNKSVHGKQKKIKFSKEISYRTQEMYLIVYLTRYGDLLYNRRSLYLTFMKLLYIGITAYIIYLIKYKKPYCLVNQIQELPLKYSRKNSKRLIFLGIRFDQ